MANILKCNAEFERIYYVKFNNTLRECKLIRTRARFTTPNGKIIFTKIKLSKVDKMSK